MQPLALGVTTTGALGAGLVILLGVSLFLVASWKLWTSRYRHWSSPCALPWVGTVLAFPPKAHDSFTLAKQWMKEYDHLICLWLGPIPFIITSRADYTEAILSSKTLITKSGFYKFVKEWLGTGLLTSTGVKWKKRRRAITPSFHFNILNGFASIFEEQAQVLVEKLNRVAQSGESIDIQLPVSLAKLDVICETSMGVKVNAQGAPTSSYVTAINSLNSHIQARMKSPWLWPRFLYTFTAAGQEFYKNLDIVQGFTSDVINRSIARRKAEKEKRSEENGAIEEDERQRSGGARRKQKVFLDTLLDLFDVGEMDIAGIQDEVDTFMFEGHDTTATALSWTLYELGRRPDLQERLHAELTNADASLGIIERVKSIKYLDHVLKEGLRLHPPVPIYARIVDADTVVDGKMIPKGTNIAIFTYMLHRNPTYWNDPDTFNPDRFGEEEFFRRHPYVFVPFSAGSRNCIGQKFALLEEKIMLYYIVLKLKFVSLQKEEEICDCFEVIHKSENGLYLNFQSR